MADEVDPQQVDVRFIGPDGQVHQVPWLAAAEERTDGCSPVRAFAARRGKRLAPGWWWSSTTCRLVPYGTAAMRDRIMLLDRDPDVVDLRCCPLEFVWRESSRVRRHAPQLMACLFGGERLLMDCLGPGGLSAQLAHFGEVLTACARSAGWEYRLVPAADPVVVANVRWLSGYRHPRCANGISAGRLHEAFMRPRPLVEGAAALGDVIRTLPAVFHGLWSGLLEAPLEQPLHERVTVTAVERSAA